MRMMMQIAIPVEAGNAAARTGAFGPSFQKNGEAEVSCALALLQDLVRQLGRRFLDVLVGDALYLQAPFVQEVERLDLVWAFTPSDSKNQAHSPSREHSNSLQLPCLPQPESNQRRTRWADGALRNRCPGDVTR